MPLPFAYNKISYAQQVQTCIEKTFNGIPRAANNGFSLDVKGCIEDYRYACVLPEAIEQFPKSFIYLF